MRRSAQSRVNTEDDRNSEVCPRETSTRLRTLYPAIRERENDLSLPRRWDISQASSYLEISRSGLTVFFKTNLNLHDDKDPSGVVRSDAPIPSSIGLYYFEVNVLNGQEGSMGIGLSKGGGELNRMPGWDTACFGYHGDDGHFFSACGTGKAYGPKFGTGDVIGCGIDTVLCQIFFTKNGAHLGLAYQGSEPFGELYPTVGLKTPGEQLHVNFGQKPFMFDFEGYCKVMKNNKMLLLEKTQMPEDVGDQMDRIVSSFLGNSGAFETLKFFKRITEQKNDESEFLEHRKEIVDMIMSAAHGARIQNKIELYFPGCLERDPRVQLILLCLRYIDLANTLLEPPSSFRKPISEFGQPISPAELRARANKLPVNNHKRNRDNRQNATMFVQSTTKQPNVCIRSEAFLNNPKIRERFTDDDTGEEMLTIDGLTITKTMFIDLQANDQSVCYITLKWDHHQVSSEHTWLRRVGEKKNENPYEKLSYVMKMGREIMKLSKSINLRHKERQILEISMTMVLTTRPIEKHPLSSAQRRYIANLVISMINEKTYTEKGDDANNCTKIYSELRGMFIGWKAIHADASSRDHPSSAVSFMKTMVVNPVAHEVPAVKYSDEPIAATAQENAEEVK